jgi:hypothetical protein
MEIANLQGTHWHEEPEWKSIRHQNLKSLTTKWIDKWAHIELPYLETLRV